MSLSTKLIAGYMLFVAALIVLGGWSAWRLLEMGGVSRRIISNNYDLVVAALNSHPCARARPGRRGARARDLEINRRDARRADKRAVGGGARHDLHVHSAGRRMIPDR